MSTETGMNDRQKLEALKRLSALTGSAMEYILTDECSFSDVTLLLEVMQAFKEGKVAAFIQASKSELLRELMVERWIKLKILFDIKVLEVRVEDVEFTVRTQNCLQNRGIETFRQLVFKTERDLLMTKNFSRKSLKEVKEALLRFGLCLGMTEADFDTTTKDT